METVSNFKMTLLMLRARCLELHDSLSPLATKLMGRALRTLAAGTATDKSDRTSVKKDNSLTINNKVIKSLNDGDKVLIRDLENKISHRETFGIEKHSAPMQYIVKTKNDYNL